jgi:hypothetical protein
MLFLVKGPLRHEAVWHAWFERAAGLLPAQAVSDALCRTEDGMPEALTACSSLVPGERRDVGSGPSHVGSSSGGSKYGPGGWHPGWHSSRAAEPGVLDRQHLFDVHVHPHPNFTGRLRACRAVSACCLLR